MIFFLFSFTECEDLTRRVRRYVGVLENTRSALKTLPVRAAQAEITLLILIKDSRLIFGDGQEIHRGSTARTRCTGSKKGDGEERGEKVGSYEKQICIRGN